MPTSKCHSYSLTMSPLLVKCDQALPSFTGNPKLKTELRAHAQGAAGLLSTHRKALALLSTPKQETASSTSG